MGEEFLVFKISYGDSGDYVTSDIDDALQFLRVELEEIAANGSIHSVFGDGTDWSIKLDTMDAGEYDNLPEFDGF